MGYVPPKSIKHHANEHIIEHNKTILTKILAILQLVIALDDPCNNHMLQIQYRPALVD